MYRTTANSQHPWSTLGGAAAASWLTERGLSAPPGNLRWHAEIALDVVDDIAPLQFDDRVATRFHLDLYFEEWGFFFCHGGRASWIRVTDVPFVHGRDDFQLLAQTPPLSDIGTLLRGVERDHGIQFRRDRARIRTNLQRAEAPLRAWVEAL